MTSLVRCRSHPEVVCRLLAPTEHNQEEKPAVETQLAMARFDESASLRTSPSRHSRAAQARCLRDGSDAGRLTQSKRRMRKLTLPIAANGMNEEGEESQEDCAVQEAEAVGCQTRCAAVEPF